MSRPGHRWHEVECGGYAADLAAVGGARRRGRRSDPGAGLRHGPRRAAPRRGSDTRSCGVDADAALVETVTHAPTPNGSRCGPTRRRRPASRSMATFALALAPMQLVQMLGGATQRRGLLASVRSASRARAASRRRARRVARPARVRARRRSSRCPAPGRPRARRLGLLQPAASGARSRRRARDPAPAAGGVARTASSREEVDITELDPLSPAQLEAEARAAGLRAGGPAGDAARPTARRLHGRVCWRRRDDASSGSWPCTPTR